MFFFPEPAVLSPCAARESLKCPVCKMLTNHRSSPSRSVLGMRGAWLSPRVLRGGLAPALAEPARGIAHSALRQAAAAAHSGADRFAFHTFGRNF